jgi:hypothetical protein
MDSYSGDHSAVRENNNAYGAYHRLRQFSTSGKDTVSFPSKLLPTKLLGANELLWRQCNLLVSWIYASCMWKQIHCEHLYLSSLRKQLYSVQSFWAPSIATELLESFLLLLRVLYIPCGGRIEYLHRSTASRMRRRKGNPVHGGISGPPCF